MTGHGCSWMPRWWRRRGRPGRAHSRASGKPLSPSRRPNGCRSRCVSAGNENERRHLLPLVDALHARGIKPRELWADRGYDSRQLDKPPGSWDQATDQPAPAAGRANPRKDPHPSGTSWPTTDPQDPRPLAPPATACLLKCSNAWLRALRRIATRRDRKPDNYLAFLQLGMILILARSF